MTHSTEMTTPIEGTHAPPSAHSLPEPAVIPNHDTVEVRNSAPEPASPTTTKKRRKVGRNRQRVVQERKQIERVYWENQKRMEYIERLVENLLQQLSDEERKALPDDLDDMDGDDAESSRVSTDWA